MLFKLPYVLKIKRNIINNQKLSIHKNTKIYMQIFINLTNTIVFAKLLCMGLALLHTNLVLVF